MKTRPLFFGRLLLPAASALISFSGSAQAGNSTWGGAGATSNWSTVGNWTNGLLPGSATGAATSDIATFSAALVAGKGGSTNPVLIDTATLSIGGVTFTGASVGAYQIGTNAGNALILATQGAGYGNRRILVDTTAGTSQVIAAPLKFVQPSSTNGSYGFVNNATNAAVTLTLSGTITNAAARPAILVLDGTNTGNNTISGAISETLATQGTPFLVKFGSGTWILSGANTFSGTPMTDTSGNFGIQVLDGVLSAQNNTALGNTGNVWIAKKTSTWIYNAALTTGFTSVAGGTLELANNITLDNGVTLNLLSGGTIRSSGSTTANSTIKLGNAALTTATLSTVGSSDVFTVGNAANDFTGGAADSVVNIAGPGTVLLGQASNYAGTVSINAGTLKLGNATALGSATTAGVNFGASSTGKLVLNGNSATVATLNSNSSIGTVENNNVTAATLTVSNTTGTSTYGGLLQNGAAGTLALTKDGASSLILSGTNTYSGGTTITAGTLTASSSSALGSGTVGIASGATLSSGNLSVGAVTLTGGANIILNGFASQITSTGAVSISGLTNSLSVGGSAALAGNTYNLLTGTSLSAAGISLSGSGVGGATVALGSNSTVGRTNYAFAATATALQLSVTGGAFNLTWNAGSANWNTTDLIGQKDGAGPNIAFFSGDNMTFAAGDTIAVDAGGITAGTLAVSNGSGTATFNGGALTAASLAKSGAGTLNLNTATTLFGAATVSGGTLTFGVSGSLSGATSFGVTGGTLDISATNRSFANVSLTNGGSIIGTTGVLTGTGSAFNMQSGSVSAILAGSLGLTKSTAGTVTLSGANQYTGTTTISAGTLAFTADNNLGASAATISLNGGTLSMATSTGTVINTHVITVGANGGTIDTGNQQYYLNTANLLIGSGALTVNGNVSGTIGSLRLGLNNSFTGTTAISSGALVENQNATGLGSGAVTVNSGGELVASNITMANAVTANGGSTLSFDNGTVGTFSGAVALGTGTTTIALRDWYNNGSVRSGTISGAITGSGGLAVNSGTGTGGVLTLSNALSTYSGGTTVSASTINLGNSAAAGTGAISLGNGATLNVLNSTTFTGNAVSISGLNANATLTTSSATGGFSAAFSGSSDQTLTIGGATAVNLSASSQQLSGFSGTVSIGSGSFLAFRANALNNGGSNALFNINGNLTTRNGGAVALGGLSGSGTVGMGGSGGNNIGLTYTIGARNSDTIFSGSISEADAANGKRVSIVKTGTGSQTFSGINTYTGATSVNAGTLALSGAGTMGNGTSALTLGGGTLALGTTSQTVGAVSITTAAASGNTIENGSLTGTSYAASNTTGNAVVTANLLVNGGADLTKSGAGTLTLTGTNTYTGATAVNAGKLVVGVAGVGSITSNVTVASSATIGGSGTITGNLTLSGESSLGAANGGTLAAGNSPGVLTATGTTNFNTGSIFSWDLDSTQTNPETNRGVAYDGVNTSSVTGSGAIFQVVLQGTQSFGDNFWTTAHTWSDIFTTNGTTPVSSDLAAVFSSYAYANGSGALANPSAIGSFTLTGSTLSWSAVPEPTSALAGLLLGAGLLRRRRSGVTARL